MPFAEEGEILICESHKNYMVPLIWTFKHRGAEYWCPFCGNEGGMFGTGDIAIETPELIERKRLYKAKADSYLRDKGDDVKWKFNVKIESITAPNDAVSDTTDAKL